MMNKLFCFVLILSVSLSAMAESITLNWGINHELDYFKKAAVDFKRRVEKRTKGKIQVSITEIKQNQEGYPHLDDVKKNKFQMGQETIFELEKILPVLSLWSLPFLFRSDKHIENYIQSAHAKQVLSDFEKHTGLVAIDYTFSGGFVFIYGEKLNHLSELNSQNLMTELATTEYMNLLRKQFNTNIVNDAGQETYSEIIAAVGDELYPKAKFKKLHVNITNHRVISRILFISRDFLNSLPKELRNILLEECRRVAVVERELSVKGKLDFLKVARAKGLIINQWTSKQRKDSRDSASLFYSSFERRIGGRVVNYIQDLAD